MVRISLPPIDVLLSWPKPNYTDTAIHRGPTVYVVSSMFLALATVAVVMRLYARIIIRHWFGLDDAFICIAWVAAVGVSVTVFMGSASYGWDRHVWDIPLEKLGSGGKLLTLSCLFWAIASSSVRLSLLCFYFRLTEHIQKRQYRWVLYSVIVISIMFLIAYVLVLIFMCIPVDAFWHWPPNLNATCIDLGAFLFSMSIVNTLLELVCALLPIPAVLSLQMDRKQRWGVIGVLSLGILVVLVGCVRVYFVHKTMMVSWDTSWWGEAHWITSEVENDLSLICACAPALRPVLGRIFNKSPIVPKKELEGDTLTSGRSISLYPKDKMQTDLSCTQVWFDLEGIQVDGLGYTVTISSGTDYGHRNNPRTSGGESASALRNLTRLRKRRVPSDKNEDVAKDTSSRVGIVTKTSVEIRESFHEASGSEEMQVWKSISEKDHDSDWIDDSWAVTSRKDARPSQAHKEAMKRFSEVSSQEENSIIEEPAEIVVANISPRSYTAPTSQIQARPMSSQSLRSSRLLSRPVSRGPSPANPVNSSQSWAGPMAPRTNVPNDAAAVDNDVNWTLEMATMRDRLHWGHNEGSMLPEDGSRPESTSPSTKAD